MAASNRVVHAINLGRMGFLKAYDIQLRYARDHLDYLAGRRHMEGRNILLLVEHNPVFTVGIRTHSYDKVRNLGFASGSCVAIVAHVPAGCDAGWSQVTPQPLYGVIKSFVREAEGLGARCGTLYISTVGCACRQLPALLHEGRGRPTVSYCASVGIHVHVYS